MCRQYTVIMLSAEFSMRQVSRRSEMGWGQVGRDGWDGMGREGIEQD